MGKTVKIIKGSNRGYVGRIIGETDTHVRLELQANCQIVTIPKSNIDLEGGEARRRTRPRPDTPSTPWQAPKTPMHTPSHSWGSTSFTPMTPIHPSMTPLHTGAKTPQRSMPNRTPLHQSLMNPTPLLTKDESSDDDDGGMGFGPPTNAPFTPARTPAMSSPPKLGVSETSGAETVEGGLEAPKSSLSGDDTKDTKLTVPANSQDDIIVKMDEEVDDKELPILWDDLVVSLPSGELAAVSMMGASGMCEVVTLVEGEADEGLKEGEETKSFNKKDLTPVQPKKHDFIRVLNGAFKGSTGSMIGIDGTDGIVKLDGTCDIKVMEIGLLGKVLHPSSGAAGGEET